eukprot:gb/GECG01010304.1/.p1 GENE.gb/GECG01010304.1/~~gb/GECG01010304.1/.p1  ORF type:complete len:1000 (+),score=205.77 gb/GECG01010304.1/:1-3000(+)
MNGQTDASSSFDSPGKETQTSSQTSNHVESVEVLSPTQATEPSPSTPEDNSPQHEAWNRDTGDTTAAAESGTNEEGHNGYQRGKSSHLVRPNSEYVLSAKPHSPMDLRFRVSTLHVSKNRPGSQSFSHHNRHLSSHNHNSPTQRKSPPGKNSLPRRNQVSPENQYEFHVQGPRDEEEYEQWPKELPPPRIVETLGRTTTLRCVRLPNARYTFQWTRPYVLKASWKNAEEGAYIKSNEFTFRHLQWGRKYVFRVKIQDYLGQNPALYSPICQATTLSPKEEVKTIKDRFQRERGTIEQENEVLFQENEELNGELEKYYEENMSLRQELETVARENAELRSEMSEIRYQNENFIADLKLEKSRIEQRLESKEDKLRTLESTREQEKKSLENRIAEIARERQDLSDKCNHFLQEIQQLYGLIDEKKNMYEEANSEKQRYSRRLVQQEEELQGLRKKLEARDRNLKEIETEKESAATKYFDANSEVAALKERLEEKEKERLKVEEERNQYAAKWNREAERANELQKRARELEFQQSKVSDSMVQQEEELYRLRNDCEEKKQQLQSLHENYQELRENLRITERSFRYEQQSNEKFQEENSSFKRELEEKDQLLNKRIVEKQMLLDKIDYLSKTLTEGGMTVPSEDTMEREISEEYGSVDNQAHSEGVNARLNELYQQKNEYLEKSVELENELNYLRKESEEEKQELNQVTVERDELEERCRQYEQNIRELQQAAEEKNKKIKEVKQISQQYKDEARKLQDDFQQLAQSDLQFKRSDESSERVDHGGGCAKEGQEHAADTEVSNNSADDSGGDLHEEVQTLRQKLKRNKSALKQEAAEKERLLARCTDNETELQELHQQLQDYEYNLSRTMSKLRKHKETTKSMEDSGHNSLRSSQRSNSSLSVARVPVQARQQSEDDFSGGYAIEHAPHFSLRSRGSSRNSNSATSQQRFPKDQRSPSRQRTSTFLSDSEESESTQGDSTDLTEDRGDKPMVTPNSNNALESDS